MPQQFTFKSAASVIVTLTLYLHNNYTCKYNVNDKLKVCNVIDVGQTGTVTVVLV